MAAVLSVSKARPWALRILGYVAYFVFSTLALVLAIEGAGRVVIHFRHGLPGKTYGLWIPDPELGATHRPHGYNTHTSLNGYGLRNREEIFDPKPSGSLRVLVMGGSTTFGYNLADGETYTERLEERLRRRAGWERSQVLNAGRITYSAAQNLILMRRLVPALRPDYALLYEGVNELFNAWMLGRDGQSLDTLGERYGVLGRSYDYNRWLLRNSVLVRFIDYEVKNRLLAARPRSDTPPGAEAGGGGNQPIHPWIIRNYDHLLREEIRYLRSQGATVIVFRYPTVRTPVLRFFADMSARISSEEGVTVCDLESRFDAFGERKAELFIETGVHVTPRGAEILAEEVEETIVELEARRVFHDRATPAVTTGS